MLNSTNSNANRKIRKALVTGGAGFIGSHLVDSLINQGVEVISFDDYSAGKKSNLDHLRKNDLFTDFVGDITKVDDLRSAMKGVDTVFHQAASKKTVCMRDPSRDLEVNGGGALRLLQMAMEQGVEKFVHASTGSVYGEPILFPQTETHRLQPTSYYGVSKLAGESYVKTFAHLYGLDTTVLRYFHAYGPRQESSNVGGVVSIFLKAALKNLPLTIHGDGKQVRSFTWVGDIVQANILAATNSIAKNKTYNCASGINVTIEELASMVLSQTGIKGQIQFANPLPGDIREFNVDNSLITSELGIVFNTNFDEGLKKTLDWAINALKNKTIE